MGLKSVSASKDVIGDPSRPGTNNSELLEPDFCMCVHRCMTDVPNSPLRYRCYLHTAV